jgi:hypothetical protein
LINIGDKEREMGQEVAAFLDRNATNTFANSINFIDFLALPFFEHMGKLDARFNREVQSRGCVSPSYQPEDLGGGRYFQNKSSVE